jgi:hypothetical protein
MAETGRLECGGRTSITIREPAAEHSGADGGTTTRRGYHHTGRETKAARAGDDERKGTHRTCLGYRTWGCTRTRPALHPPAPGAGSSLWRGGGWRVINARTVSGPQFRQTQ